MTPGESAFLSFLNVRPDRCGFGDSELITSVFKPCIPLSKLFLPILKNLLKGKKSQLLKILINTWYYLSHFPLNAKHSNGSVVLLIWISLVTNDADLFMLNRA